MKGLTQPSSAMYYSVALWNCTFHPIFLLKQLSNWHSGRCVAHATAAGPFSIFYAVSFPWNVCKAYIPPINSSYLRLLPSILFQLRTPRCWMLARVPSPLHIVQLQTQVQQRAGAARLPWHRHVSCLPRPPDDVKLLLPILYHDPQ